MGELICRLMNSDIVLYVLYFALALLFVVFLVADVAILILRKVR